MYSPAKEKYTPPPSPRLSLVARRIVPRHAKAYVWLGFLTFVFGSMLLIDNGIPFFTTLPSWSSTYTSSQPRPDLQLVKTGHENTQANSSNHLLQNASIVPASDSQPLTFGIGAKAFTPDDVVVLFKTGATALWRRVPMHLSTTLADASVTPHVALYSDQEDRIAGRSVVDVLANVSDTLKASADFELYRQLQTIRSQNLYLEAAAMDGDHYLPGGWRLDKYKFLPLMAHAARAYPDKKWYIYMEDDNYYFFRSLYAWLGSEYDPSEPHFLGSPAARLGEDFAHGGSGFVVSGAAMKATFGSHRDLAALWESYAVDHCCGDQVLSHALASLGVTRDRRHDHSNWMGLQALPTWRMAFGDWNWCSPLFNVHKTHQADISRLHELEQAFVAQADTAPPTMTWGYLFEHHVAPALALSASFAANTGHGDYHRDANRVGRTSREARQVLRLVEWDNDAAEKWHASKLEADEGLSDAEKRLQPWYSADMCEAACWEWSQCLSWKYADDACGLSSTVAHGRRIEAGVRTTSGFMMDRIGRLTRKKCS